MWGSDSGITTYKHWIVFVNDEEIPTGIRCNTIILQDQVIGKTINEDKHMRNFIAVCQCKKSAKQRVTC